MESHVDHVFNEELMNLGSMFFFDQDFNHFTGHGLFSTEHDHGLNDLEITPILSANESISSTSCNIVDDQILSYSTSDHDIGSNFCNNFSQDHVFDQYNDLCMMGGDNSNFLFLAQIFSDDVMDGFQCLKQDEVVEKGKMGNSVCQPLPVADLSKETHLKRKYEMLEIPTLVEEGNTGKINKNKTTVVSNNKKNKRNLPPKKVQKMMVSSTNRSEDNGEETRNINRTGNVHSPSSCNSEDDSNTTQDVNQRDMVTEKTRAGRGAATDPQSIYARKRRERINERLRTLQTLVPNGTKVDISTMLEEAVHYVKFLQLQINLLSSDDKWMYAPIAYNGVDMGLYQNIITPSL